MKSETSTEKAMRLLATYPKTQWEQRELALAARCSKAFLSRLTKRLQEKGIIARPSRHGIILVSLPKLLNYWISIRKFPEPIYFKSGSYEKTLDRIRELEDYCLALLSAAYFRSGLIKAKKIELYYYGNKRKLGKTFGKPCKFPSNLVVFISDRDIATGSEVIEGLRLVSLHQNYVDLMASGGTAVRVAVSLDRKYNLMGV